MKLLLEKKDILEEIKMKESLIIMATIIMMGLLFAYPSVMIDVVGTALIIALVSPFAIGVGGAIKENKQMKDTL
jgi:hypothetical protein